MEKRVGEPLYSHLWSFSPPPAPPGIIFGVVAAKKRPDSDAFGSFLCEGASLIVEGRSAEAPPSRGRDVTT